jgi:hypothetical protein
LAENYWDAPRPSARPTILALLEASDQPYDQAGRERELPY